MARKRAQPLLPPSDEELADAEARQAATDQRTIDEYDEAQETQRLARAGDPEAIAAMQAGATILNSQPAGPVEEEMPTPKARTPKDQPKPKPTPAALNGDDREREKKIAAERAEMEKNSKQAYQLMDAAFRKWKKAAAKDPRKAFRELACDLGGDTALFMRAGILRLSDMTDTVIKMMAIGKGKEADGGEADEMDQEIENLRQALRGD